MFSVLSEIADKKISASDLKNCSEVTGKREVKDRMLKWFLLELLEWWRGEEIDGGGEGAQEVAYAFLP